MVEVSILIISILLTLVIGCAGGYYLRLRTHEKSLNLSKMKAESIITDANALAEKIKNDFIFSFFCFIFDFFC